MTDFATGIAPDHVAALGCALVAPLLAVLGWRIVVARARMGAVAGARLGIGTPFARRLCDGWAAADAPVRWAVWLLVITAVVHLGLPLGHTDGPLLTVGFVASGAAAGWLALRAILGRRWRGGTVGFVVAVLTGYAIQVGRGGEEADQVGLATAVVELALLTLAIVPALTRPWSVRRLLIRPLANSGAVSTVLVLGVVMWAAFLVGHDHQGGHHDGQPGGHHDGQPGGQQGDHHGAFLARAQAGIVLRPDPPAATPDPGRAAALLAERTRVATAKYRELAVARADGFRASGNPEGLQVHLENKANQRDGRIADPARPEMLVYAVQGGRSLLLGVVFQMPVAGERGPAIGGTATRWHAHNVCVGLLPPGFGAVSPFGTCPFLTLSVTIAEMMHVWVVDPPGGPFAEQVSDAWVRTILKGGRPPG